MEDPSDRKHDIQTSSRGGMRTMPFIIANESFEKVASFGLLANMIIYLVTEYHINLAAGASILFVWSAISNFTPIFGAFLSDSYLGRFVVICLGSIASLLGMIVLWLTSMIPTAKPPACDPHHQRCKTPIPSQLALLFISFGLMSIGAGGVRPCSMAFGADQFDKKENPKNARVLQSFFNWYYASVGISILISVTVIVYIQDQNGWRVGFGVPAILMALSAIFFFVGSPFYVKVEVDRSMFSGLSNVMVAAFKNRRLDFPRDNVDHHYHHSKGSKLFAPTDNLRFLNKACVIRNYEEDINPDGSATKPSRLCTIEQVEDLKSVIKVIPIWSTGIMIAVTISQHAFPVLQAKSMDRHVGPKFIIPPGSFGVFAILTLTIWVAIYDRIVVPLLVRFTNNPRGLGLNQRMGIGLLLSVVATAIAAMVERARRNTAIEQGLLDDGDGIVNMSALWLVPQHCLTGLAEAFNAIGQIQFYYSEFPKTMSSIGVALFSLGMGIGNLVGSLIVVLVDYISSARGKESWVGNNLNKSHYDYYYWVLAALSFINFLYFILCSWAYGPGKEDQYVELKTKEDEHENRESSRLSLS